MKIIVIDDEGRTFEQAVAGPLPAAYALHLAVSAIKARAAEAARCGARGVLRRSWHAPSAGPMRMMRRQCPPESPFALPAEGDERPIDLKHDGPAILRSTRHGAKNRLATRDESSRPGSGGR